MNVKSLIIVGALTLGSLGIASAKSYDITLTSPTKVGDMQLKPGQYRLKIDGTQAIFTDVQNSKELTAQVEKIEKAPTKFSNTTIESTHEGDMDTVHSIDLGGSTTKLDFAK